MRSRSSPIRWELATNWIATRNDSLKARQQRVAICRALITKPKLILADEPTGNLDPKNKHRTLDLLFEQAQLNGQTIIVVTHDMSILDGFDRSIDFTDFQQADDPLNAKEVAS